MTIEERIKKELLDTIFSYPTDFDPLSPEGLPFYRMAPALDPDPDVIVSEKMIPGPENGSDIKVYIFAPKDSEKNHPGLLFFHGGGYAGGATTQSAKTLYKYVKEVGCVIVSPEYRLAPENPYPAGLEDCYATTIWFAEHADELNVDASRIAVSGGSAGGGLAIAVCLLARDKNGPSICFQMPLYPTMDDRMTTPSMNEITYERVLNRASCENIWNMYLGEGHKDKNISFYASPGRATDLTNLPPCYSFVGDLDPHRDETINYISNLVQAGVPTGFTLYSGCYHGFEEIVPDSEISCKAVKGSIEALIEAFKR